MSGLPPRSSSSPGAVALHAKARENWALFRSYLRGHPKAGDVATVLTDIDEYELIIAEYGTVPLKQARVLEIGFGARPYRMMALLRKDVDVTGIDLDVPVLYGTLGEYRRMLSRNGLERTMKSALRRILFDRQQLRELDLRIGDRRPTAKNDRDHFIVGDAADLELGPGTLDLIISEDVFEHIEPGALGELLQRMSSWMTPTGLVFVRPNVYTGITGGHLVEWSSATLADSRRPRRSEPWDHLRRRRFQPNSYLNQLRLRDYRKLFSQYFEIVEERVKSPNLGQQYLTNSVRADLQDYTEEELLANQVLFVLRRRRIYSTANSRRGNIGRS